MAKRKPLSVTQIKCIYMALLDGRKEMLNLREFFKVFDDYEGIIKRARQLESYLFAYLMPLSMPKYLQFLKNHLTKVK